MAFSAPHFEDRQEILSLTSLRFFAALVVVLSHIAPRYPFPDLAQRLFHNGYAAVSFFFVLSGFVLVYAYAQGDDGAMRTSKFQFWLSRIGRIAPAYYLSFAIIAPIFLYSIFVSHMVTVTEAVQDAVSSSFFLQALMPPFYDVWNPPAWSLSVEAVFYVAFPFLIGPCFRLPLRGAVICGLLSVGAVAAARFIYFWDAGGLRGVFSYDFPLFHFPAFIVGMIAARIYLFGPKLRRWAAPAMVIAGASGVLLLRLYFSELQSNAMLAPLFALIICGVASRGGQLLAARPLVVLGHASYAIYILHWPLRLWWLKFDKITALDRQWPWLDCGLYLILVIGASLLTFYLIERPARALLLGAIRTRR